MRKILFSVYLCLMVLAFLAVNVLRAPAQTGDPWSLIAEVNALRASYGLPAYKVNRALMAAAQAHSEYQAKNGTVTHSGPGGSRPHGRAVAAGYGGGAQVYVSENIAMGINLSPKQVVYEMWQDALHLETMISTSYRDIGAGVAVSRDYVYYTIDVGYVAGSPGSGSSSGPQPGPGVTPAPTVLAIRPVQVATPRIDGSIIHVVDVGQALWNIHAAYKVPLAELLALNGLTESSFIFPGDKILVRPALTLTETMVTTGTVTATLSAETEMPSPTATKVQLIRTPTEEAATPVALAVTTEVASPEAPEPQLPSSTAPVRKGTDYLLIAIVVMGVTGIFMIALGSTLKRST